MRQVSISSNTRTPPRTRSLPFCSISEHQRSRASRPTSAPSHGISEIEAWNG